ncbi:hypothetical protein B0H67DRAFT_84696 [Lasiosphaeris hirsuta]|uniref:Secreted protein n=1 Tax=Lasiosphaeris hirsuta TaxID=260670 RepID=A0AA40BCH3_9PEZI|nr:hypothetical protein B0H67DRAFT_84696 [Lasiosphaeris hirsuta]
MKMKTLSSFLFLKVLISCWDAMMAWRHSIGQPLVRLKSTHESYRLYFKLDLTYAVEPPMERRLHIIASLIPTASSCSLKVG